MNTIRESLLNPRVLSEGEIRKLNFDEYSLEEIEHMIQCGLIEEKHVVAFYGNEWWNEVP
jgi:hypothetical protein